MLKTKSPPWSHGRAIYQLKVISTYRWGKGFMDQVLPHELSHLVFRDFVGTGSNIPYWLDEGIACYMEKERGKLHKEGGLKLFNDKLYMELSQLNKTDTLTLRYTKDVRIFYLQALSLVGFMIEKYGSEGFCDFLRQLRDGKDIDEALRFAYPTQIRDVFSLQEKWLEYLREEEKDK